MDLEEFFFAVVGVCYVFELVEEHGEEAGIVIGVRAVTNVSKSPTTTGHTLHNRGQCTTIQRRREMGGVGEVPGVKG